SPAEQSAAVRCPFSPGTSSASRSLAHARCLSSRSTRLNLHRSRHETHERHERHERHEKARRVFFVFSWFRGFRGCLFISEAKPHAELRRARLAVPAAQRGEDQEVRQPL